MEKTDENKLTDLGSIKPEKLIDEEYSYDNLVKNPIIKPISETDRAIEGLMEMAYKKSIDATKYKKEINESIEDVPAYQTSNLIGRLLKRNEEIDDIIKLQNLIIKGLRDCIKEIYNLVINKYGVYKEEKGDEKNIDYKQYLINLLENEKIKEIVSLILTEFENDHSVIKEKDKFEKACAQIYSKEKGNERKVIIAKIMRQEY